VDPTASKTLEDGTGVTAQTTVPQHAGNIPIGTLRSIEKDMASVFGEGWLR
jgi:predicted RNA binding protein YcfA (HicA-like mRNA interferase family)